MLKNYLLTVLLAFLVWSTLYTQEVWPGDVNNNGVVNEVDLLYWGIAFGETGPARDEVSTDWQAYNLPAPWAQNFPNGNNYALADCNGDGEVNEDDFDAAVEDNFGLQHLPLSSDGYSNAGNGNAPRLILEPSAQAVEEGAIVDIQLRIDDSQMSIENFYGIAISLRYSTGLLEGDDGPDFELADNSWIESDNSYIENLYNETDDQGMASLGITRTNQIGVPVESGPVGTFSIVIEDIIVGLEVDTFYLWVDSIKLISSDLSTIAVTPDTAQIIIAKDLELLNSSSLIPGAESTHIKIFPNPARKEVFIQSESPLSNPIFIDRLGRIRNVGLHATGLHLYQLDCTDLLPGMYYLKVKSNQGVIVKKIIISH